VSFLNATLVLSIGDIVEEVTDSGFLATAPTLEVGLMRDNSIVQVHSTGIRHIRPNKRISEWKAPGKRQLEKASVNESQVAISMSGGDLVYFELDAGGNLVEEATKEMGKEVSCLDVGEVPAGRAKSMFLVVGSWDNTVRAVAETSLVALLITQLTHCDIRICVVRLIFLAYRCKCCHWTGATSSPLAPPSS
jgi:splicing factor 3B subunit 3